MALTCSDCIGAFDDLTSFIPFFAAAHMCLIISSSSLHLRMTLLQHNDDSQNNKGDERPYVWLLSAPWHRRGALRFTCEWS